MSIVEIARQLGVHANTARFHLDALIEHGRVERVPPTTTGPGRPPFAFRLKAGMDPHGPRNYELLAALLVGGLGSEPDTPRRAGSIGREWGRRLVSTQGRSHDADSATDELVELLDKLGFAPERRGNDLRPQIGLRNCPFLELAGEHADVVCPIHLGLMQGFMETVTSASSVETLTPFVEPDLCLAQLVLHDD